MSEITYDDKADLIVDTTIDDIFKVSASNMNEIKNVVNGNAEEVGDITSLTTTDKTSVVNAINELNAPEKWVSVGATAPTDGRRVWFKKSKNLLKLNLITTATTYSGVTFTPNNDGTITLNGTATGSRWVDLSNMEISSNSFNLGAVTNSTKSLTNNNYTLSAKITSEKVNVSYNATNEKTSCYLYADTTYNNAILQIQFEKGSTATAYEPYAEPSINVDEELLYQKPVVLWTNPNPTSAFASQTITLNDSLANYSYYEVLYKTYKDENIGYNTGKIPTNWGTNIYGIINANDGGVRNRIRSVTINSSTQIGFASCSLINTKGDAYTFPDNDRLIPYKILGYKE